MVLLGHDLISVRDKMAPRIWQHRLFGTSPEGVFLFLLRELTATCSEEWKWFMAVPSRPVCGS